MTHSNIQTYFLLIKSPKRTFVMGTRTQRGFTEPGAERALVDIRKKLPKKWTAEIVQVESLSALF